MAYDDFTEDEEATRPRVRAFFDWRRDCGKQYAEPTFTDTFDGTDGSVPSGRTHLLSFETKVRNCSLTSYPSLLIEQDKYVKLMKEPGQHIYMCFLRNAVVIHDLDSLPEPKWQTEKHNKKTRNMAHGKVDKQVAYLPIVSGTVFTSQYIKARQ